RRAKEGAFGDPRGPDIGQEELLQVMPHRDLARLTAFLRESERILRPIVHEVLHGQLGDRSDAGRRVDEDRQYGPVAEPTGFEASIDVRSVRAWSTPISGVLPSTTVYRSALTVAAELLTVTWRLTSRSRNGLNPARWSFLVGVARPRPSRYSPTSPGLTRGSSK